MGELRTYGGVYSVKEDATRCIESVPEGGRSVASYQCARVRGFGKDGLYCKQHAKQFPTDEEVTLWWKIDYRGVRSFRVTEETDKCLYVSYGAGHRSSRQAKTGREYRTEREACEAWVAQTKESLDNAQSDYDEACTRLKECK